jgi:uncharacterized protein (DUF1778 family)
MFTIRLSEDERALVAKAAAAEGLSASDWARRAVLGAANGALAHGVTNDPPLQ